MRPAIALSLFGWSILCSGCALIEDGNRNLCVALSTPIETHREMARNRRWAEDAWRGVAGNGGPCKHTNDYAQGFKDGYAEYLFRGGDSEPPLVAPLHYRQLRYQTPKGYLAVEDWFAGYRHGAALARDSGARQFVTGPSGLRGEINASVIHEQPTLVDNHRNDAPLEVIVEAPQFQPLPAAEKHDTEPPVIQFGEPMRGVTPVAPDPAVEKPAEPVRAKITNVSEAPEPVRVKIMKVIESPKAEPAPAKARITGISAPEPVRARITTITVMPPKE